MNNKVAIVSRDNVAAESLQMPRARARAEELTSGEMCQRTHRETF